MVNRLVPLRFRLRFVFPLLWGLTACIAVPEKYDVDANFAPGIKGGSPGTVSTLASAATSTITGTGPVTANGVATSTITIILKDANGNPVSGYTPTFTATDTGATNVYAACSVGVAGVSTCTMTSTKAETKTLSIATPVAKADGTVVFQAGTPTAANSTVTILPASVIANGAATIAVTVTLKDASSSLVSGKTVTLASSRGATDTVATVSGTTNASGEATFTVSSSTTGSATLTATDTTDAVVVTQTGKALFLAATPWTDYQAQNFDGASNSGSNTSSVKAAWKDLVTAVATRDGALSNYAYSTSSGWGGDGGTTITSGADGPYRLIFDGTDDFTSFGTGVNTNADFSFETWVYPSSSGGLAKAILSNGATANSGTITETNTGLTLKQSKAQAGKVELHLGERSYADEVLADSPIAYWRLGEVAGSMAMDASGNGNLGAYISSFATLNQAGALVGDSNRAISLTDRAVTFAPINLGTTHTADFWLQYNDAGDGMIVGGAAGVEYATYIGGPGAGDSIYYAAGGGTVSVVHGGFTAAQWYYITVVRVGTSVSFYRNGAQIGATQTLGANPNLSLEIMGAYPNGLYPFVGNLDEVAVYDTALTTARIAAHYYAGLKRLTCTTSTILANSSWYHLAGVFSSAGPTLKLMVNGTQECSVTLAGAAYTGSGNDLRAGRDQNAANSWTGAVSDLRTWASALTNANVVSNYGATSSRFPAFTSTTISGLKLWLKADTGLFQDSAGTTAVTANADPVGKWSDQSGSGYNVTQGTAGNRPTYRTNVQNGQAVIRFDGTDDTLFSGGAAMGSDAATVFVVAKVTTKTNYGMFLTYGWNTGGTWNLRQESNTGRLSLIVGSNNFGAGATGPGSPVGATADLEGQGFKLLSGYFTADDTWLISENGADKDSRSYAFTQSAGESFYVGARSDGFYLNGDIAEVLVYNSALSDTDRKRVEAYLNSRYSLY